MNRIAIKLTRTATAVALTAAFAVSAMAGTVRRIDATRPLGSTVPPVYEPAKAGGPTSALEACGPSQLVKGDTLVIKGSTTLRPISDRAQTLYDTAWKNLNYDTRALGSTTGVRALIEGACKDNGIPVAVCDNNADGKLDDGTDIAQSSRPWNATEKAKAAAAGLCIAEHAIAIDGLGIIVNPSVNAGGLTLTQDDIQDIYFNNAVVDWSTYAANGAAPGPIMGVSRQHEGGTYGSFQDLYICQGASQPAECSAASCGGSGIQDGFPPHACNEFNGNVVFVGSNDEIVDYVQSTPGGIGYVGIAFIPTDGSVYNVPVSRSLADTPYPANFQTVQSGQFQFRRNLFWYTNGEPALDDTRGQLLSFILSPLGQTAVWESGYVPVVPMAPQDGISQTLLEPLALSLFKQSQERIAARLDVVDDAYPLLPGVDALTDVTESEHSVREAADEDLRLVKRLRDRVALCVAPANANWVKSNSTWATALAKRAALETALASYTPASRGAVDQLVKDLYKALNDSFAFAAKAHQSC